MPAYLGGPLWPDVDAALVRRDLVEVLRLAERDDGVDMAERQLLAGLCRAVFHQGDLAAEALLASYHGFGAQTPLPSPGHG